MSESRKKVEITLGSFACSVEGYDDPLEPMREILLMMRDIMGDAPALSGREGIGAATLAQIEGALDESAGRFSDNGPGTVTIRAIEGDRAAASPAPHGSIFARPPGAVPMLPAENIFAAPAEIGVQGESLPSANIFAAPEIFDR
ncbi:MAG TPA: hypothetical protein VK090_04070 [Paracoccaceae bacterium]|nr:hypothetical protein [Paracoccaceae bacterium]